MNDKRRSKLKDALQMLSAIEKIINQVCDQEDDCMANYPENLQGSEAFEKIESAVDSLTEALEKTDEVRDCIASAMN